MVCNATVEFDLILRMQDGGVSRHASGPTARCSAPCVFDDLANHALGRLMCVTQNNDGCISCFSFRPRQALSICDVTRMVTVRPLYDEWTTFHHLDDNSMLLSLIY
jgi:hypothetical protein